MKKKFELLQIFRGIAAMLVVIYHLSRSIQKYFQTSLFGDVFSFGLVGVDFFFVLSGFIITYVHFSDLEKGTNLIPFLKKRFIRIYPIYWIIASIKLLLLYFNHFKSSNLDYTINLHSLESFLYLAGCYLLIPMPYDFFLGVAWSLVYEVLFYVVFFLFMWVGFKKARYFMFIWAATILVKIFLSPFYHFPDLTILNKRVLEFLTGFVVAYLFLKSYSIPKYVWMLIATATATTIYLMFSTWAWKPYGILPLALINGLLVYKIVETDMHKQKTYPKIFSLIGEASYSIYLSHIIFLALLLRIFKTLMQKTNLTNFFVIQGVGVSIFILSVTGGVFIYKWIEFPLIKYLNRKMFHQQKLEVSNTSLLRTLYEGMLNLSARRYR